MMLLDKALEKINTFELLSEFGLKNIRQNGDWWNCCCPFHHDRTPSFGMNKVSKVWKCFSGCGSGDLISFLMRVMGISRIEAIRKVYELAAGYLEEEEYDSERVIQKLHAITKTMQLVHELPSYDPSVIEGWRYIHPLMIERGFKYPIVYQTFRCGYSPMHNRLTFPVFFMDQMVGVQSRTTGDETPRYKPLPGYEFPTGSCFYNFCPEYDRVVLVEGVLDCLKLWQYGRQNVMALFGSHVTEQQAKLILANFREVVLWLDHDQAGFDGTIHAINTLGGHITIEVSGYPKGKNDPGECNKEEIELIKANTISSSEWVLKKQLGG